MMPTKWKDKDGHRLHDGDMVRLENQVNTELAIVEFMPLVGRYMFRITHQKTFPDAMWYPVKTITHQTMEGCGRRWYTRKLRKVTLLERRTRQIGGARYA